jgi:hypothetical protein
MIEAAVGPPVEVRIFFEVRYFNKSLGILRLIKFSAL